MRVIVIGSTGKIGRLTVPKLIDAGHSVIALVRASSDRHQLPERGVEIRNADLESDIAPAIEGAEACVFTAGSGPSTGKDKTLTVDLWGAVKAIRCCKSVGIERFVMVSALKAHDPELGNERLKPYLVAKHAADWILERSGMQHTILRPGRLSDAPGTGLVAVGELTDHPESEIPRDDVAAVITHCLNCPTTVGNTIHLLSGNTPIKAALESG